MRCMRVISDRGLGGMKACWSWSVFACDGVRWKGKGWSANVWRRLRSWMNISWGAGARGDRRGSARDLRASRLPQRRELENDVRNGILNLQAFLLKKSACGWAQWCVRMRKD